VRTFGTFQEATGGRSECSLLVQFEYLIEQVANPIDIGSAGVNHILLVEKARCLGTHGLQPLKG